MSSQSSLMDFTSTPVEQKPLILNDAHMDYLYEHFSQEGILEHQIQEHLLEEKAETEYWKKRYDDFVESSPQPSKSQYLRVGDNGKSKGDG